MDAFVMPLLLGLDVGSLTMSLVNIDDEVTLADSIEAALRGVAHLDVDRAGDVVVARASSGSAERVVVAGRLDAPPSDGALARVEMGKLFGPGASDAKGALAMMLKVAAAGRLRRDVTFVFGGDDLPPADFVLSARPTSGAVTGASLDHPLARRLVELTEVEPVIVGSAGADGPTVAFGPGDPALAGTPDEFVPTAELTQCEFVLRRWLTS